MSCPCFIIVIWLSEKKGYLLLDEFICSLLLFRLILMPEEPFTFCMMPDWAKNVDMEEAKFANWSELIFQLFLSTFFMFSTRAFICG